MADWFKLHENWFHEPRFQWAIKEQATVLHVWLWALTECCRTKSDTIGLHSEDYEMIGIQQLLNISPGLFNQGLNLLEKIKYLELNNNDKTIKVLQWNNFQNEYLSRRERGDYSKSPQLSATLRNYPPEERRGEENRRDKKRGEGEAGLKSKQSSEEFIASLKVNPLYSWIAIDAELLKMDGWLQRNPGRKKTQKFILSWLGRIEKPVAPFRRPGSGVLITQDPFTNTEEEEGVFK